MLRGMKIGDATGRKYASWAEEKMQKLSWLMLKLDSDIRLDSLEM
jgi:hypothetical protein